LITIPAAVYALGQEVEQLILSNNGIKTIPYKIKQLTNLKLLDLTNNAAMRYNKTAKAAFKKLLPNCELKIRGY
jgi:Leucine-rich repeat (LRR) protein